MGVADWYCRAVLRTVETGVSSVVDAVLKGKLQSGGSGTFMFSLEGRRLRAISHACEHVR